MMDRDGLLPPTAASVMAMTMAMAVVVVAVVVRRPVLG